MKASFSAFKTEKVEKSRFSKKCNGIDEPFKLKSEQVLFTLCQTKKATRLMNHDYFEDLPVGDAAIRVDGLHRGQINPAGDTLDVPNHLGGTGITLKSRHQFPGNSIYLSPQCQVLVRVVLKGDLVYPLRDFDQVGTDGNPGC